MIVPQLRPQWRRRARLSLHDDSNASPGIWAHRSASKLFPECTMEGYRACIAAGITRLEADCHLLSDGRLGIMHDTTVDRTTTGTGAVSGYSAQTFTALNIDSTTVQGGAFGDTLHPPLLDDLLMEMKGKATFCLEAKSTGGTTAAILAALARAGIPKDQAMVGEFGLGAGTAAVAAGYQGFYSVSSGTAQIANCVAAGIKWVFLDFTAASDADIAAWKAAGLKVVLYTITRRSDLAAKMLLGIDGVFTDDPLYLGRNSPFGTSDTWLTGNWMPGQIDQAEASVGPTTRGRIDSSGRFGWPAITSKRFGLQGWACPIKGDPVAPAFKIDFKLTFGVIADGTRWGAIWLPSAAKLDMPYLNDSVAGEDGHNLLFRRNGVMEIFSSINGTPLSIGSATGAAFDPATGGAGYFQVERTPTQIFLRRMSGSVRAGGTMVTEAVATSSIYQGGYFHTGHSGVGIQFSEIDVS